MKRIAANDGQFLFWYDLRGLGFFAEFAFALIIFSPVLFTSYWISTKFVAPKSTGHVWIMVIILFALLIYTLLIFLKGFIVGLRQKGNYAWILLFIPYIAFICVPPVLITLPWAMYLTNHNMVLSWMLEGTFALFVYSRYNIRVHDHLSNM